VLESVIVPNDTRAYVSSVFEKILCTPGRNIVVDVVFTDDVAKDKQCIENLFQSLHKQKVTFSLAGCYIIISNYI
jgi:hypothetical protein